MKVRDEGLKQVENRCKLNNDLLHNSNRKESAKALVLNRILSSHVIFLTQRLKLQGTTSVYCLMTFITL